MEQSNKIQFVLPHIASSEMSRDDQGALLVNQATASIIDSYLTYSSAINENLVSNLHNLDDRAEQMRISPTELISLINNVQTALTSF